MARNSIWSSSEINTGVAPVQNFLVDLFFIMKGPETASYADDNISYISAENLDKLLSSLVLNTLFKCFADNLLQANTDIGHPLISGTKTLMLK